MELNLSILSVFQKDVHIELRTTFTFPGLTVLNLIFLGQAYMAFYNRVRDALDKPSLLLNKINSKSITALNKLNLRLRWRNLLQGKKIHDADISHNIISHIAQIDQYLKDYNTSDLFEKSARR